MTSADVGALAAAFANGNENRLIEELRKVSSQRSRREARIALVARILEQTGSPKVRNAAALALADMRARDATEDLVRLLRRNDTKGYRGTLLYALEQLDAALPASLLVEIITEDAYESREEALSFIARGKFDRDQDPRRLQRRLTEALESADEERAHAINVALEFLSGDGPGEIRGAD
ncbi:MAG TPA: HEAT repeat domain-containing protein [Stellaceae bacterium]|nr:HEAT repeat domain-containing protein [Stellaceae bacterium]